MQLPAVETLGCHVDHMFHTTQSAFEADASKTRMGNDEAKRVPYSEISVPVTLTELQRMTDLLLLQ